MALFLLELKFQCVRLIPCSVWDAEKWDTSRSFTLGENKWEETIPSFSWLRVSSAKLNFNPVDNEKKSMHPIFRRLLKKDIVETMVT